MISNEEIVLFNRDAMQKVYFYNESGFWSKPNPIELRNWLSNFQSLKEEYCALKLLDRFVYYSEADIIRLIEYGLNEKIIKRYIRKIEQENDFLLSNEKLIEVRDSFLKHLYFIPLNTGNLSQSSLAMIRHLTVNIGFPEERILDPNNLDSNILNNCKNLVIIDDFIGSGKQISDFWNDNRISLDGQKLFPYQLKEKLQGIQIEYFCLVCTQEGHDNFKYDYEIGRRNDLIITYSEMLTNKFKVFSKDSIYFENDEIEECKDILTELCSDKKIELLGYQGLDYAIAFHHSIPDCSLPLFFTNNSEWNYLFRNKKTESDVQF